MCGVLFGMDCARRATEHLAWQITLPKRNMSVIKSNRVARESRAGSGTSGRASDSNKISSVVQITDVHIDPYYLPGTDAACGQPLCCREANGRPVNSVNAAGTWGDYGNCDTPIGTVRASLKHIGEKHKDVRKLKMLLLDTKNKSHYRLNTGCGRETSVLMIFGTSLKPR